MTELQLLLQIRDKLRTRLWSDKDGEDLGSGDLVFGTDAVVITAGSNDEEGLLASLPSPCAVIIPGTAQHDPGVDDDPRVLITHPTVRLFQSLWGDRLGQNATIGGYVADEGVSDEQGLLSVQEQVLYALADLSQTDGVFLQFVAQDEGVPVPVGDSGIILARDLTFSAKITTERFYPPATRFTAVDAGSGNATLAWENAPDRYDFLKSAVVRKSGATAPTSLADGTRLTLASNTSESHTDNPGAGEFSYSVFMVYDDRSATPTNEDHVSERRTQTEITVTA